VLARTGDDFSDEDLMMARQIQLLLQLVHRQACVLDDGRPPSSRGADLTGRELAVIGLLAEGLTALAIGHRLGVSERTIHKHLEHAYGKLGAHDRLSAVAAASRAGLVRDGPASSRPNAS
jgi:DNA-binding NarL/FixJ family response regulator